MRRAVMGVKHGQKVLNSDSRYITRAGWELDTQVYYFIVKFELLIILKECIFLISKKNFLYDGGRPYNNFSLFLQYLLVWMY